MTNLFSTGMSPILNDKQKKIFLSERLMRLVFEYALSFLPHKQTIVKTPQGVEYEGLKFSGNGLCGVSILRAGETMEHALMKVTKDIRLGKISLKIVILRDIPR